jgi:hypothetical protein
VTTLKPGDRVRVTERADKAGCKPGDKGTLLRLPKASSGESLYIVSLDKEDSGIGFVFLADEIESDV